MKKLLALLLVLALLTGLTACGVVLPSLPNATGAKPAETTGAKDPEPAETKAPVPQTDASTTPPAPDTQPTPDTQPVPDTQPDPEMPEFQEMLAFDTDACSMKILRIEEDDFWGIQLVAQVENKTEDTNLRFSVDTASVNGVCYDPYFSASVAAGKKASEDISFSEDDLNDLIGAFTDIELTVRVYDADDWSADDLAVETFHVYPYGESRATTFVRSAQPEDMVLVDNDDYSVIVTGYDPEGYWGYTVKLYLVNKTDLTLGFTADDVSVNGFMCEPLWGSIIAPGKVAFDDMDWSTSSFEELGITDVEEIEFLLRVFNYENFWGDDLYAETVTLHP